MQWGEGLTGQPVRLFKGKPMCPECLPNMVFFTWRGDLNFPMADPLDAVSKAVTVDLFR